MFIVKNQRHGIRTVLSKMTVEYDRIDKIRIELEELYDHFDNSKDVDNTTKQSLTHLLESLITVYTDELHMEDLKRRFVVGKFSYTYFRKEMMDLTQSRSDKLEDQFGRGIRGVDGFTDELSFRGHTTTKREQLPKLLNQYYDVPLEIFKEEYYS